MLTELTCILSYMNWLCKLIENDQIYQFFYLAVTSDEKKDIVFRYRSGLAYFIIR